MNVPFYFWYPKCWCCSVQRVILIQCFTTVNIHRSRWKTSLSCFSIVVALSFCTIRTTWSWNSCRQSCCSCHCFVIEKTSIWFFRIFLVSFSLSELSKIKTNWNMLLRFVLLLEKKLCTINQHEDNKYLEQRIKWIKWIIWRKNRPWSDPISLLGRTKPGEHDKTHWFRQTKDIFIVQYWFLFLRFYHWATHCFLL